MIAESTQTTLKTGSIPVAPTQQTVRWVGAHLLRAGDTEECHDRSIESDDVGVVERADAFAELVAANSKAHAEQIRSVAVERLGPVLGRLPAAVMDDLEQALRLHLQR